MFEHMKALLPNVSIGTTDTAWQTTEMAGYCVEAKVMDGTVVKLDIYDDGELVYHEDRGDVDVRNVPDALAERIVERLETA